MEQAAVDRARDMRRVAAVDRYGLQELAGRAELRGLAELAARLCGVAQAMISYVDETHLRMLASTGFEPFDIPREQSICSAVLYDDEPLVAEDLLADARFSDSFAAVEGLARFYASQQVLLPSSGEPVGSLCVFDPEPRVLDDGQRLALAGLAARVGNVLELGLRTRQLSRAVAELERSNTELSAFAGQMSHDLRNPLTAMTGLLDLMGGCLDSPEPDLELMRGLVDRARSSTTRMSLLLNGVLTYATLGGALAPETVDVAGLVAAVQDDLDTELDGLEITIGPLADVVADPVQLRIVVQNLLSNAAKHARDTAPQVDVDAVLLTDPERTWRLRVADHGPGIPEDSREAVFDPFVRLDRRVAGTGMGLATCRRIVEGHGGRIRLEETPGGGATVWVELPTVRP